MAPGQLAQVITKLAPTVLGHGHERAAHLLRMDITHELIAPRIEWWDRVFNDSWSGEDLAGEQCLAVAAVDRHVVGDL